MSEHQQERQEAARTQTESRAAASAHEYGIKAQTAQVNDRKQNPRFYDKYTRSSVEESDRWEGIVDEFSSGSPTTTSCRTAGRSTASSARS